MASKIFAFAIIWVAVIAAYIIMAAAMPGINEIIISANTSIAASGNMSQQPGIQEAVMTAPVWLWGVPALVGLVTTAVMLVKDRMKGR